MKFLQSLRCYNFLSEILFSNLGIHGKWRIHCKSIKIIKTDIIDIKFKTLHGPCLFLVYNTRAKLKR